LNVPGLRIFLTTILIVLNIGFCGLVWFTPNLSYSVVKSQIQPEIGKAYHATLGSDTSRIYRPRADSAAAAYSSNLMMFEDGRALGPAHSPHADIRQNGGGRFSHWDGSIIFSTTDGTDPRTNTRVYSVTSSTELKPNLQLLLISIVALADVAFFVCFRKEIISFQHRRRRSIFAVFTLSLVLLAALSAFGVLGTIVVAKHGPPEDAALALQALQHAVMGCVTSLGTWAAGAGIIRFLLRDPRSSLAQVLIPAFPLSMALLAALLAVTLLIPWGRSVALAFWLTCLLPLSNWRPPRTQINAVLKAVLVITPLAMVFGIWLGLLWHGPTDTLAGSPSGDLTFYAGSIWSLAAQPYPRFDLGFANGGNQGYFNMLYPALGAALVCLPNFDPFLFLLASGGTSYVLLSGLMLHLYAADRVFRPISRSDLLILTLSVVVAARYPYWVTESIPLVFVPALTISVWWMAERGRQAYGWSVAAMLAGLGGSLLSKVVTAAVLVPLGSVSVWSRVRGLPLAIKLTLLAIAGIFGLYGLVMLLHFVPLFAATATIGPESFRTPRWYFASRDMGAVLMMAIAWIVADWPVALSLSFGLVTFIGFSWIFQANFVCVSIVLGLILVLKGRVSIFVRMLGLTAFALSLPALILGDQASPSSGVIWMVCIGGSVLVAVLNAAEGTTKAQRLTFRTSGAVAAATLVITGLGLVGVARGSIIADSGWHFTQREPLTPALKEVWAAVRERTPKDALIFTDQVDDTQDILGGWNNYAFSGERQIYLSSYFTNFRLRYDKEKRNEVLATNAAVLKGDRSPRSLPVQRTYGSFYAVVAIAQAVPANWRPVFKNHQYALYQIDVP
jgi:hypothetical protein